MKKKPLKSLTARDIMSKAVLTLTENSLLQEAVHLFIENHVSAAPVLDLSGNAIGVITKTDLARFEGGRRGLPAEDGRPAAKVDKGGDDLVRSWMTPFVLSVDPDAGLAEITRTMVKNGVHHLFVKAEGKLVGVISTFDVLRFVSRSLNSAER